MDSPFNQSISELFQAQEIRRKKIGLYIKICCLVYFVICIGLIQMKIIPLNGVVVFLSILGLIVLTMIISSPLNVAYSRILKLAIQNITQELTGNGWQYWASFNLAPNEAYMKSRKAFPFSRSTMINYVLKGQYKNTQLCITAMSIMKGRSRGRKDPRYDFNGHIFNFSGVVQSSGGIIITNASLDDYFNIPSGYKLDTMANISIKDLKIYKFENSSGSNDLNKMITTFQKISVQIPNCEILLKMEADELMLAINDEQNLFDQVVTINEKTDVIKFIKNTEEAIHYLIGIAELVSGLTS